MLVVRGYDHVPPEAQGAVLAIGNFDGVHKGHQALIAAAVKEARAHGRRSGALLFEPHPREYFRPDEDHFHLTSLDRKLRILEGLGLDLAVVLEFGPELANLDAEAFIERVLVSGLHVSHIVIGYHFFFGRNRGGTSEMLRLAGEKAGFGVTVVGPVAADGEVFSSTAVRLKLAEGNVKAAAAVLGRLWSVEGKVVGGAKRGTGLGFPTANIPMPKGTALGHGIYAVRVDLDGTKLDGAAYLGTRPTFDNGMPVLEVFLFDFDGDIYGRNIRVTFVDHIRPDRKFDSPEALVAQMTADCDRAREILAAHKD